VLDFLGQHRKLSRLAVLPSVIDRVSAHDGFNLGHIGQIDSRVPGVSKGFLLSGKVLAIEVVPLVLVVKDYPLPAHSLILLMGPLSAMMSSFCWALLQARASAWSCQLVGT
jgi:hypothetical protein